MHWSVSGSYTSCLSVLSTHQTLELIWYELTERRTSEHLRCSILVTSMFAIIFYGTVLRMCIMKTLVCISSVLLVFTISCVEVLLKRSEESWKEHSTRICLSSAMNWEIMSFHIKCEYIRQDKDGLFKEWLPCWLSRLAVNWAANLCPVDCSLQLFIK